MNVNPADEGLHEPGPELLWNESWYFDFGREDGSFGGYLRVGLNPNQGTTWYLLCLVGKDLPTVRIDDKQAPLPTVQGREGVVIATDGYRFEHRAQSALTSWRITGGGTAESADPTALIQGKTGAPAQVELDLTWTTDGTPFQYDITTRYEIPCLVSGSVTIDGTTYNLDDVAGQRDHSWGVRDWRGAGWCWSTARLSDGRRMHLTDVVFPTFRYTTGYLQDGAVETVTDCVRTETFDAAGLPLTAELVLQPSGLRLHVETLAHGPTLISDDTGRWPFPRSLARYTTGDGLTGTGWIEWNRNNVEA